jgi:heme/copper-type cytochrome/quinol oxidase subunit 3
VSEQPHAAHDDHGDHGHGDVNPFVQHHYDDAKHQFDSGKFGIWLFLAQEVLFFSALFVAYILYRHHHPEIYAYAHKYLDTKMGAINTAVLIFSSLTAAWAVRAAQLGQKKLLVTCLVTTIACACTFLVVKYEEYTHKVHEHLLFGNRFDPCVSSNDTPLATKLNECPGTKTTIESRQLVDDQKATIVQVTGGCFPNVAIDADDVTPGVQANCKVYEVHGKLKKDKDKTGKDIFTVDEKSRKEVTNRCKDPWNEGLAEEGVSTIEVSAEGKKEEPEKFPCWKPSFQPAVCKTGWFFPWTCDGGKCERATGGEGPFDTLAECTSKKNDAESKLKGLGKASVGSCARGGASAILVDYGDKEERESPTLEEEGTKIIADCSGPASVGAPDFFNTAPPSPLAVGKKTTSSRRELTDHEKHEKERELLYSGPPPEHTSMFFTIYFAMTGLHGIHVLIGIFVFIWLTIRATKGHFTPDYFGPIDFAALYWHIVDLIWIFLFPLLYLIH